MVFLQPCSLGLVIIFSWPFQHRNQCSKVSCPPTSTLTPSTSPCAQPACGQRVHTMLPLLLQVSHPPHAVCLCPEDPQLHTSPLHTHTTDCWFAPPSAHQRVPITCTVIQTISGLAIQWTSLLLSEVNHFSNKVWIPSKYILPWVFSLSPTVQYRVSSYLILTRLS